MIPDPSKSLNCLFFMRPIDSKTLKVSQKLIESLLVKIRNKGAIINEYQRITGEVGKWRTEAG